MMWRGYDGAGRGSWREVSLRLGQPFSRRQLEETLERSPDSPSLLSRFCARGAERETRSVTRDYRVCVAQMKRGRLSRMA